MNDWFLEDPSPQSLSKVLNAAKPIIQKNRLRYLKSVFWIPVFAVSTVVAGFWLTRQPEEASYAFLEINEDETELLAESDFEIINDLDFLESIESEEL